MALIPFQSRIIADTGISMGDEGKGRLIHEVVHEITEATGNPRAVGMVLKVNGGSNSGHTAAGLKLNLLPCGVAEMDVDILNIDNTAVREAQVARLHKVRAERDEAACQGALDALGAAAGPYLIDDGGRRPRRYRLLLPPEVVRFAPLVEGRPAGPAIARDPEREPDSLEYHHAGQGVFGEVVFAPEPARNAPNITVRIIEAGAGVVHEQTYTASDLELPR